MSLLPLRAFLHMIPMLHRFLVVLGCMFSLASQSQKGFTISGEVKDFASGESAIGALVVAKDMQKGTSTNVYGFYSLTLPPGKHELEFSYLGYVTEIRSVDLTSNITLNVELKEKVVEQKEVVIEADRSRNVESTDVGKIELEVDQIKKLPVLLGEVDILKTLTLLPGVQSSGEGNAGFYVRGGGVDQNLILLDNAVVYNASHLFGFFSVFNADAVKNLELTKGGVPAMYGGRISSVLDINLKEGNYREYHATGGIGTIASRLTVEGPIKRDTSSFIVSARRTYIDILLRPFVNPESNFAGSGYYFYDLNAKLNYRLSKRDQLFVSGYFGRDVFGFESRNAGFSTRIPWGNSTATVRWNRIINTKLFMNAIATFTDYRFAFEGGQDDFRFSLRSGIRDIGGKVQWNYFPNFRHKIKWGAELTHHTFTPNNAEASSGDTEFDFGPEVKLFSYETAVYAQDEFDVTEKLSINAGLRFSYFIHLGPFDRYIYDRNAPTFGAPPRPTMVNYERNQRVADYAGLEPRFNFRYQLNRQSSIKGGFMHNYQYVHLTSFSPTSLPTDVWLPSTDVIRPQRGTQVSLGYFRNFKNDAFETSVEIYYKDMRNLSEFRDGADPQNTVNDNIDNLLVFGRGYSYGSEFLVRKRAGRLNGWVGYTWSRTMRVFEAINRGEAFPSRWDRRHDMSFVVSYQASKRVDLGFVFVYGTGNAITLPVQRYFVEGRLVDIYGDRNSFRMAPYHRADISCTVHGKETKLRRDPDTGEMVEKKKRIKSNWNFSVYNLYNRMNPYFIYFGNDGELSQGRLEIKAYQVSLFPILPSVTWNFEF